MFESISAPARPNWKLRAVAVVVVALLVWSAVWLVWITQMPLRSYKGSLPPLTHSQSEIADQLAADVKQLSVNIGERSLTRSGSLQTTTDYLKNNLRTSSYDPKENAYPVAGQEVSNIEATLAGTNNTSGALIVGAHYDSVSGTVGANDNATGVAAVLELARLLQGSKLRRPVKFAFFANEEPPYFQTTEMGSFVYARQLHRDNAAVSAMISVETIGFYSDVPGSQKYPPILSWFYPSRGNFIGFVGNSESRDLVRRSIRAFRQSTHFPSEGVAAPDDWPGVGWSDHWSFWKQGYPAIMVTDTAVFRYPQYHTTLETLDKVDFQKMSRVVEGLREVVVSLANEN